MQKQARQERERVSSQVEALKRQERVRVEQLRRKGDDLRQEGIINRSKRRLELMENRVRMTK